MFSAYTLPGQFSALTIGGNVEWQGKTTADGEGPNGETYSQGSLAVVDLLANYRFTDHLSLAVHVENIFDKTYYSGLYLGSARYGEPRAVKFTLRGTL